MKSVKRTMYYPEFNPTKNEFDYTEITHERDMTKQEKRANTAIRIFWWLSTSSLLVTLVLFVIGVQIDNPTLGFCGLGAFVILAILIAILDSCWITKVYLFLGHASDYGFDFEVMDWEQTCQQQNDIAEKWRAEHPLEEAIRRAQETKNCNDIATLLKLYQSGDLKL